MKTVFTPLYVSNILLCTLKTKVKIHVFLHRKILQYNRIIMDTKFKFRTKNNTLNSSPQMRRIAIGRRAIILYVRQQDIRFKPGFLLKLTPPSCHFLSQKESEAVLPDIGNIYTSASYGKVTPLHFPAVSRKGLLRPSRPNLSGFNTQTSIQPNSPPPPKGHTVTSSLSHGCQSGREIR